MGVFKRANWHSGLTYKNTCPSCNTTITYKDDKLDFRPWYPDGFVYCPTCEKPLRHNENLAIDSNLQQTRKSVDLTQHEFSNAAYCENCGHKFQELDNFCSKCGTKR